MNNLYKKLEFLIPPPIYLILFILTTSWLNSFIPTPNWSYGNTFFPLLAVLFLIIGITLDFYSVFIFLKQKTTINPLRAKNTEKLVVKGFYRYTRNPMYLGLVFILLAKIFWLQNLLLLILLPIFMFLLTTFQIKPEEKILYKKFGEEYKNYQRSVRRWL